MSGERNPSGQNPSRHEPAMALGFAGVTTLGAFLLFGTEGPNAASDGGRPQVPTGPEVHWVTKEGALPHWNSTRDPSGHTEMLGDKVDPSVVVLHQRRLGKLCATKGGQSQPVRFSLPAAGSRETISSMITDGNLTPDASQPGVSYRIPESNTTGTNSHTRHTPGGTLTTSSPAPVGEIVDIRQDGDGGIVGLHNGEPVLITIKLPGC